MVGDTVILLKGIKDFGFWLRAGKYHITNNQTAKYVLKKGYAIKVCEFSSDDLAAMIADWKINGVPHGLVKYIQERLPIYEETKSIIDYFERGKK